MRRTSRSSTERAAAPTARQNPGRLYRESGLVPWLARHPRFHFHFTPTSASWLNAVEGFFAKLTSKRLKRGVFSGIVDLQAAINRFLAEANECPKPFVWTADPDGIIEKVRRGREVLAACR